MLRSYHRTTHLAARGWYSYQPLFDGTVGVQGFQYLKNPLTIRNNNALLVTVSTLDFFEMKPIPELMTFDP